MRSLNRKLFWKWRALATVGNFWQSPEIPDHLPSEGRGREFESRRARQEINDFGVNSPSPARASYRIATKRL
jgi:hypothetical protein